MPDELVVVDTSTVARAVFAEPGAEEANRLLTSGIALTAPDLLLAEFSNVLAKKAAAGIVSKDGVGNILAQLDELAIAFVSMRPLARDAVDLALASNHSLYD